MMNVVTSEILVHMGAFGVPVWFPDPSPWLPLRALRRHLSRRTKNGSGTRPDPQGIFPLTH